MDRSHGAFAIRGNAQGQQPSIGVQLLLNSRVSVFRLELIPVNDRERVVQSLDAREDMDTV